jgi:hypothetical protein
MFFDSEPKKPNIIVANNGISVIDAEKDGSRLQTLDYPTWLPFAAKLYNISSNIEDFLLVTTPICPSDIPNRNGVAFPLAELTKFQPPPVSRMTYKAWKGCPVHREHKADVHEDAYGVILDASLHKVTGYGNGKLWKVMGLLAIDKYKYPEMARRVREGDVNTYSMGALADFFTCSYCGQEITKASNCGHVHHKNEIDWREVIGPDGRNHIAFRNAHNVNPVECSIVESPAWTTALSDQILG